MEKKLRFPLKGFDWVIPVAASVVLIIGLFSIQSTITAGSTSNSILQSELLNIQIMAITIGAILYMIVAGFNYTYLTHISGLLYIFSVLLLTAVLFLADPIRGSARWFQIGPVSFQPSSLTNIFLIIVFAHYFSVIGEKINSIWGLIVTVTMVIPPVVLLLLEPDLGSALIVCFIWFVLLHVTPISKKMLLFMYLIIAISIPVGINNIHEYQLNRLESFLNPQADPTDTGYHVIQSMIAVGSGQLFGRGWGRGTQSHLQYLPDHHTDFIFATYAEEQGFLGSLILIVLYFVILARMFQVVMLLKENKFGQFLALGILVWFGLHFFINVGMNIGIAPITGIPLLLFSYGGTAMVVVFLALGILQSIYIHKD